MRKSSARPRQFLNRRGAADVVARAADAVPLVVPAHVEPIGVRRTPAPASRTSSSRTSITRPLVAGCAPRHEADIPCKSNAVPLEYGGK